MRFGRLASLDVVLCGLIVLCLGIAAAQTLGWLVVVCGFIGLAVTAARA